MKVYRAVWTLAVAALVVRGLLLGHEHHPALTGTALLTGVGVAAVAGLWAPSRRARRTAAWALAAGAAAGATIGHLPHLGGGLVVIAVLVAGTAPATVSAYARWAESDGQSSALDAAVRGLAHAAPGYVPPPPSESDR
ncbi:hypothetical protein [Nocardioides sp.]|uniref:hypothetical protein n=1 Tax=Nocardioides sp. TaxID=35761 RepID=UPI0025E2A25F|nr:hypothetical protein [Nocardioides sp.]